MATLKIYPGSTGMRQSLDQIERRIGNELKDAAVAAAPRDALSMLATEEDHQARGRRLGDLFTARQLVEAHLDASFITRSLELGRERLQADGARSIKSCGWRWTSAQLPGGLLVKLETPYVRRRGESRRQRRKKRGQSGAGLYPLLWRLGFDQRLSPASRSEVARQSVLCGSLQEASEQLQRSGLALDEQSVVRVAVGTGSEGLALRQRSVQAALKSPLPQHSSLAGKRVRIALDGGRARIRQTHSGRGIRPGKNGRRPFALDWREPRVLTLDLLDEHGEPDRSVLPLYETTLSEADGAMELVAGTLRLLGVHLAAEVLFVADAAPWIWRRVESVLLDQVGIEPQRLFLALDYYHATESVAEALAACKHLTAAGREALRSELCKELLEPQGAERVIERLRPLARGRRARVVGRIIDFLHARLHLMDYAGLRARHLSIGSGVVESAVRRVVNLRFKSASMCWRIDHLEPLLYLRSVLKAGRWSPFFQGLLLGRHHIDPASAFIPFPKPRQRNAQPRSAAA